MASFCLVLLLSVSAAGYLIDKSLFWRSETHEYSKLATFYEGSTSQPKFVAMFIGDSIFANYPLKSLFSQSIHVANMGVGGNSINQVAERYRVEVIKTPHDLIVIEGGINDIIGAVGNNRNLLNTHKNIISEFEKTCRLAIKQGKHVMVMEILPVTNRFLLPYMQAIRLPTDFDTVKVNNLVDNVNTDLRKLCLKNGAYFIETHLLVSDAKGDFSRSFVHADGIHMNIFGYKVLTTAIEPYILKVISTL